MRVITTPVLSVNEGLTTVLPNPFLFNLFSNLLDRRVKHLQICDVQIFKQGFVLGSQGHV